MRKKIGSVVLILTMLLTVMPTGFFSVSVAAEPPAYSAVIGNVRVQTLSGTLARIEVKGPNGFEDRETYHIVNRDWEGVPATVSQDGGMTRVATGNYTVHVPSNAATLDGVYVTNPAGRELWRYTTLPSAEQYLPDPGNPPGVWAIADNPRVVPAEWGYSPMPEENTQFTDYNGWDSTNHAADMYIFVPKGEYRTLLKDFITLTGSSEMIPIKSFGLWHSRYYDYQQQEALDLIDKYRAEGFPLDYFVVDTDWREGASHGYEINTSSWPDMQGFLDDAHEEKNVNIVFNDHPEPVNNQHALTKEDLTYRNTNLRRLLDMGLDAWWFDRNWSVTINTPFTGINKESFGMYLYQDITRSERPDQRPMIMGNVDGIDNGAFNRAPNIASHRFSIQWTGDTHQQPSDLKQEIVNAVRTGANTATAYVSTDVGGHNGVLSNEMWTRWTQFAALSPFMRYHCTAGANLDRSPWLYGDKAQGIAQDYIAMRYRLLPLFYALSHENYETGLPLNRRLDFNYPGYAEAQDNTQYLLGDGILVAPLWEGVNNAQVVPASWLSHEGNAGLEAKFYNNIQLNGDPVLTRVDNQVDFNWGTGRPDPTVNADNFSARWSGNITIGEEDSFLALNCDDGVRMYVDGALVVDQWGPNDNALYVTDNAYEAGSTHTITLEYYEGSGNALVKLQYVSASENATERTVFIPDGRWIDVWTGAEYTGPQTITVTHKLDTSPMFVRSGTIIPLAENMSYIGEKPWDNITLDVYPSTQLVGTSELYEDDGTSVSYKEGAYRTTALETAFDEAADEVVVRIGAAQGSFDGDDAFDRRTWNVRVHVPASWGTLENCTVDGTGATAAKIAKTTGSVPFALEGGALDSDVYTITLDKPLGEESEIRLKLSDPQDEELPVYDGAPVDFDVEERLLVGTVDLTKNGGRDWAHFGLEGDQPSVTRKQGGSGAINAVTVDGTAELYTGNVNFTWSDGDTAQAGEATSGLAVGNNGSLQARVAVGAGEQQITLYLGGSNALGRLEITDGAGKTAKSIEFDGQSGNFNHRVIINASAEEAASLKINYRMLEGTGSIALYGVTVSDLTSAEGATVVRSAYMETAPETLNLSQEGIIDWMHFGQGGNASVVNRKKDAVQLLSEPVFSGNRMSVIDYRTAISFNDGSPAETVTDSHNAVSTHGTIQIAVPSTNTWRELKLYFGVWQDTNLVEIFDETGAEISKFRFSANSTANTRCLTVKFRSEEDSNLYVRWGRQGTSNGNVSLAAYSLSELESTEEKITATLKEVPDKLNFSDDAFVEWAHFGYSNANDVNRKKDAATNMIGDLGGLIEGLVHAFDYKTEFSWSDGDPVETVNSTHYFTYAPSGEKLTLDMEPGNWVVDVYTSVWRSKAYFEILDGEGGVINILQYESLYNGSEYRKITLNVNCDTAQAITLRGAPADAYDDHMGNMSITAATVSPAPPPFG